jgi:hypothetical protein
MSRTVLTRLVAVATVVGLGAATPVIVSYRVGF